MQRWQHGSPSEGNTGRYPPSGHAATLVSLWRKESYGQAPAARCAEAFLW